MKFMIIENQNLKIGRDGGFIKPSEFDQSKLGYSEPSIQKLTRHIKKINIFIMGLD